MYLHSVGKPRGIAHPIIGKVTRSGVPHDQNRADHIVFPSSISSEAFAHDWNGYAGLLSSEDDVAVQTVPLPRVLGVPHLDYLQDGDVVVLRPSGNVNVLYRRTSYHNTVLITERCNSLCLMCSQPPRPEDDSYRVKEILRLIDLIDPACQEIGISGGEPTLLGDDLLRIIAKFKKHLPRTALHILTNGRLFSDARFAKQLGALEHPNLMLGIPLYSDIDYRHDYVVQAHGAFDETVCGLYNLAAAGVWIEIRVVVHAQTYRRLPQLAEFIYRNFPFVAHIALMGMEMFGFVHKNLGSLWIDPVDYQPELERATLCLAARRLPVSIYNHQLCTLPTSLWPFARKSISDWKNVYLDVCSGCGAREFCGGFFHSATKKHSEYIRALPRPSESVVQLLRTAS
jgi:His-Xaa-Ser system radical SAM maturase HxsC